MSGHPVRVVLDLEELGLIHAPGSPCDPDKCKAAGGHEARIRIDLDANELHDDSNCFWSEEPGRSEREMEALQAAHERMHPKGTVYIEKCWEPVCRDLLGAA
jgi:hypothetical protein